MFNSKMFNQGPFNGVPGAQPLVPSIQVLEMLYLFDLDETLVAVLPQDSFFGPKHYEVLNGENTFTFSFPADKEEAQYITEGYLVGYKDLDVSWHLFEIKRVVDLHGDGLTRTAYCEHIFYELIDDIVTDKRPSSTAISALSDALLGTRWQVGIVDDLGTASTNFYYESALAAVQKVATVWKGELKWRCFISGGTITRYVDLLAARGSDTGKQFAYTKDILEIEREVDLSGVITAVYGRGKGVETASGEGYGRRLTFEDEVWTIAGGDPADKPADQEWVGDTAALALYGRPGGRHRYGIYTNEDQTDAGDLLQEAWDYLQTVNSPRITYDLKVVTLETLSGYSHEAVRLGDLVRVIDREFTPELVVSARVVELTRDLQDPSQTEVILGSFYPTIVETTIETRKKVNELANKPHNTKWLDGVIDVLQNAIENSQAYIWETPQGTLHLNAPTYAEATEAMLLGGGRFAIANQKDGLGGWNWRTFGTGAGFTADEINAGLVKAEFIQIGEDTTFENGYDPSGKCDAPGYVTADTSGFSVYDSSDVLRVLMGSWLAGAVRKYGIKIINGEIYSSVIQSGEEGSTDYIRLGAGTDPLTVVENGNTALSIWAYDGGMIQFYDTVLDEMVGQIVPMNDAMGQGLKVQARDNQGDGKVLGLQGSTIECYGDLNMYSGTKHNIEQTENYGQRTLSVRESPEQRYVDEGFGTLVEGVCRIEIDPIFIECIEPNAVSRWYIYLTPYVDVGLYVAEIGADYFIVKESSSGTTTGAEFVWSLSAARKNYAMIRFLEVLR